MEENDENEIQKINEDFNYDETVEIIDKENGSVNEGKIVSIRGDLLLVYNKSTKQEERLLLSSIKTNKKQNKYKKIWSHILFSFN